MALSTTRTLLTQTGINTHQVFDIGGLDSVGVATFSNFKTGSTSVHNVGIEAAGINAVGVVTATKFVGDISDATGAAAGLGTALSQTQTSPLNKIYFTDNILSIGATITIDPPPSSTVAYTNYSDIKISGADLIIKDGDDFIPDVLGLSTTSLRGRYTYN